MKKLLFDMILVLSKDSASWPVSSFSFYFCHEILNVEFTVKMRVQSRKIFFCHLFWNGIRKNGIWKLNGIFTIRNLLIACILLIFGIFIAIYNSTILDIYSRKICFLTHSIFFYVVLSLNTCPLSDALRFFHQDIRFCIV